MKLPLYVLHTLLCLHAHLVCGSSSTSAAPDYVLVATAQNLTINCQTRYSVVLNGTSPGPPLYMKEGQTTWIRVFNHIEDQNVTVVCCSPRLPQLSYPEPRLTDLPGSIGMD